MSSSRYTDSGPQGEATLGPMGLDYIPTEEERRVFKECNTESFWYRSVPFSLISMTVTQALISRGALTASARFGSLPKVAFAGVCGYLAGKMSYMKTCQEKFKSLEHSPLGEALRQRQRHIPPQFGQLNDPQKQSFDPVFQQAEQQEPAFSNPGEFMYSDTISTGNSSTPTPAEPVYVEDDETKRKPVLYEELRSKNRENYEVTLTEKAEILLKPSSERAVSKRDVKKNIYGDEWEE